MCFGMEKENARISMTKRFCQNRIPKREENRVRHNGVNTLISENEAGLKIIMINSGTAI